LGMTTVILKPTWSWQWRITNCSNSTKHAPHSQKGSRSNKRGCPSLTVAISAMIGATGSSPTPSCAKPRRLFKANPEPLLHRPNDEHKRIHEDQRRAGVSSNQRARERERKSNSVLRL